MGSHRVHDAGRANEIPLAASVTTAAAEGDAGRDVGDDVGVGLPEGGTVAAAEQATANVATSESSAEGRIRAFIRCQTPEPVRWLRSPGSR